MEKLTIICLLAIIFYSCKKETNYDSSESDSFDTITQAGCIKTVVTITSSQLNTNTIWDSCHYYYVKTNVNVSATLTIEPGTIIKFNSLGAIQVNSGGVIKANGTKTHPVVFTSDKDDFYGNDITGDGNTTIPQKGDWNRINTNGQSGCQFKYCFFQYGGNSSGGGVLSISANSQSTTIDHCNFKYNKSNSSFNSASAALDATGGGGGTVITNNSFDQNILPLGVSTAFGLDNSNDFSNNQFACIQVSNLIAPQQSISWKETKQPFAINCQLSFITETLSLSKNVVLKFTQPTYQLTLQTKLNLSGFNLPGVRFTSFKDDYNSFDSNGDGSATTPQPGDWLGIRWNERNKWFSWTNVKYALH